MNRFKVGDTVKVLCSAVEAGNGWTSNEHMDKYIGKEHVINKTEFSEKYGFCYQINAWWFPEIVLKKIKKLLED